MKILELWRYPVKSMLGEPLDEVEIGPKGVVGDRQRAVFDPEKNVSLSAKRYGQLLTCRARTIDGEIVIEFPDGSMHAADSDESARALSALLNRDVIVQTIRDGQKVRHEFPQDPSSGTGEPMVWERALDAFFDRAPLHLITTATLRAFSSLQPGTVFDRARFRPNFLVETEGDGFVEDGWLGKQVRLGSVECDVLDTKPRCVMITSPQGELLKDIEVMKTVVRANGGNGGIELKALHTGLVRPGEPLTING